MKRVFVLGATGFIGQHLIAKLQRKDVSVIGYDCIPVKSNYPLIKGNFADETDFADYLSQYQIDTVYHLISTTIPKENTTDIAEEVESNVVPTLRLMEAMDANGIRHLIFVSSGGTVYGEGFKKAHCTTDARKPICGYGMQKLVIEEYLKFYNRVYGMECRIARLSNPYGIQPQRPRKQGIIPIFMEQMLKNEPITVFGDTVRDYIHIDDAVEALVKLGYYHGNCDVLNIGTGVGVKTSEIIALIEQFAGKKFSSIIKKDIRCCDVQNSVLNISETMTELEWKPTISLENGIQRMWYELSKSGKHQSQLSLVGQSELFQNHINKSNIVI